MLRLSRGLLFLATAGAVVGVTGGIWLSHSTRSHESRALPAHRMDLGALPAGSRQALSVSLQNETGADWTVESVEVDCSTLRVTTFPRAISRLSSGTLAFELSTQDQVGPQLVTGRVLTQQGDVPFVINYVVECTTYAMPPTVVLIVEPGEDRAETVVDICNDYCSHQLAPVIASSDSGLVVVLEATKGSIGGAQVTRARVSCVLPKNLESMTFRFEVFDGGAAMSPTVTIPVLVRRRARLCVSPRVVLLHKGAEPLRAYIDVWSLDAASAILGQVEVGASHQLVATPELDSSGLRVKISGPASLSAAHAAEDEWVLIRIPGREEFLVPVHVIHEP